MNTFILPIKNVAETVTYNIPFSDVLGNGEIIISAAVSISVYSGDDPDPTLMLPATVTTDPTNTIAIFAISGGVVGVTYLLQVTVTGSSSNVVVKTGYLTVAPTNPF